MTLVLKVSKEGIKIVPFNIEPSCLILKSNMIILKNIFYIKLELYFVDCLEKERYYILWYKNGERINQDSYTTINIKENGYYEIKLLDKSNYKHLYKAIDVF